MAEEKSPKIETLGRPKEVSLFKKIKEKIESLFNDSNLTFLGKTFVCGIFGFTFMCGLMMIVSILQGIANYIIGIFGKEVKLSLGMFWGLSATVLILLGVFILVTAIAEISNKSCNDSSILSKDEE